MNMSQNGLGSKSVESLKEMHTKLDTSIDETQKKFGAVYPGLDVDKLSRLQVRDELTRRGVTWN